MDEDERQTRQELMILEALVQAMDRRDEVFQVIEDSEDVDEAIRRVGQLLGVGALGSRAVLDLQSRRFTRDQRQAIASRAEELRSKLPDGRYRSERPMPGSN
jgi:DNA gyrase/topoisomerase IV subunit A